MKCCECANYMKGIGRCKFCHFEKDEKQDNWDILKINDSERWEHEIIGDRLSLFDVKFHYVDYFLSRNIAIIFGCTASQETIADILRVTPECVYKHNTNLVIINLFQERYLRGELSLNDFRADDKTEENGVNHQ